MTVYSIYDDIPEGIFNNFMKLEKIAVDTELHGLTMNRDQICLVQLCDQEEQVCLVRPNRDGGYSRLKALMENKEVLKVFHFALTDVAFFRTSLNIEVTPFCCTKVMSKLIRTYTQNHGLKDLHMELLGIQMEKEQQQTNWAESDLSQNQLKYAANDVLRLLEIFERLQKMIISRNRLPGGKTISELNETAQSMLPGMVELLVHGYGDLDQGWQTSLFSH
jgi:ribonuclease D